MNLNNKVVLIKGLADTLAEPLVSRLKLDNCIPVIAEDDLLFPEHHNSSACDPSHWDEILTDLCERVGHNIGALVVGLSSDSTSLEHGTPEVFSASLTRNLRNPYSIIRSVLPYLAKTQGSIVLVGDVVSRVGQGYIAAEGAIFGILPVLAEELSAAGVRVNAVVPGAVLSSSATSIMGDADCDQTEQVLCALPRVVRGGDPEEVAKMVLFVLSPRSGVNGEVIYLNGGHLNF